MANYSSQTRQPRKKGTKSGIFQNMKLGKVQIYIGFLGMMLLAINIFSQKRVSKKEITDLAQFTEYYEKSFEANGGLEVSEEIFYSYRRRYDFSGKKSTDENLVVNDVTKEKLDFTEIEYVIQKNDTFDKIAKVHNTKVDYIKAMNPKIKNDKSLKEGDKLIIIKNNVYAHKIAKHDTLGKIATNYKVKEKDLSAYNNVASNKLQIGKTIYVVNADLSRATLRETKEKERNEMKAPRGSTNVAKGTKAPTKVNPKETVATKSTGGRNTFSYPVATRKISSKFGNRFHPVLRRYVMHTGIDLAAKYTELRSSGAGTVSFAGYMGGYGKIIIIKHANGYETRYAHLHKIDVKKGSIVRVGQKIGQTGATGRVTGPHLHFEVRQNGKALNPTKHLR